MFPFPGVPRRTCLTILAGWIMVFVPMVGVVLVLQRVGYGLPAVLAAATVLANVAAVTVQRLLGTVVVLP